MYKGDHTRSLILKSVWLGSVNIRENSAEQVFDERKEDDLHDQYLLPNQAYLRRLCLLLLSSDSDQRGLHLL